MSWKKFGRIYSPSSKHSKLVSHAANPLPILKKDDVFRVFYSGRDVENRSSVGFVDIDVVKREVICVSPSPIFSYGDYESFYSHGISIGNSFTIEGQIYIGFMGWHIPKDKHWVGTVGRIAISDDLNSACIDGGPLLNIDEVDPLSFSYPCVYSENDDYLMWYGSTLDWEHDAEEMVHVINGARSKDGHTWEKYGLAVPYELGVAQAFSRPTVIKDLNGFHMWFSYRSGVANKTYRIGYAFSDSGLKWDLKLEKSGIDVSENGWDSEMIEYPFVFNHKGSRYMLYNGNGFGETGFGLAIWDGLVSK